MLKVTIQRYHNDNYSDTVVKNFSSLSEIYKYAKEVSNNFHDKYSNFFPHPRQDMSEQSWIGRISFRNDSEPMYKDYWIHLIENESGIVFSDGKYTDGKKFCAKKVASWLTECELERNSPKYNFVEL